MTFFYDTYANKEMKYTTKNKNYST